MSVSALQEIPSEFRSLKDLPAKPFVKWVGGKRRVIPSLLESLPEHFENYFEPFIGGGALFFHLQSQGLLEGRSITLSDANLRLIRTYRAIRDDVDSVIEKLSQHQTMNSKYYFYQVRDIKVDAYSDDADVAAWFIYLNKTAFNGLYRVNKKNRFNAPFGKYKNPNICDSVNLLQCSQALQGVTLLHSSFEHVSHKAQEGDFVYFDPPYVPVSLTAAFTSYTDNGFGSEEQTLLRDCVQSLKMNGVNIMLSNSDHSFVRDLYQHFSIRSIQVGRAINCKGTQRGAVGEVIVT